MIYLFILSQKQLTVSQHDYLMNILKLGNKVIYSVGQDEGWL